MEVLPNERESIASVAERWRRQYLVRGEWHFAGGKSGQVIYDKLRALNTMTATHADVEAIIGNCSWTKQFCHECSDYKQPCISLGYADSSATVCLKCLRKAVRMLTEAQSVGAVARTDGITTG